MKKRIKYYEVPHGANQLSVPEFLEEEIIEVRTEASLQRYIENQKDSYGNNYLKKNAFGFHYISGQGAVKVEDYVPPIIKNI